MQASHPTRRFMLLLPLVVAACGGSDDDVAFAPLRFNDLPPIQLKVASIQTEQRFIPSGVAPDVSFRDPVAPIDALKAMATDRLQAFGTANKAVFAVLDASLTRRDNAITGSFAVSLTILDDNGSQLGFAEARVQSRHTGDIGRLRPVLYDMTQAMMNDMNIEFEYQVRHNLQAWLTNGTAPATTVEQAPLDGSGGPSGQPPDQLPDQPLGQHPAVLPGPAYTPSNAPPTYLQPPQTQIQPQPVRPLPIQPQPVQPLAPPPLPPAPSQNYQ